MPLYIQICEKCGRNEALCAVKDRETCQECGNLCTLELTSFSIHGIVFSNAETSSQLGVTWNSNAEKRRWMREHPGVQPISKGSQADKDLKSSLRDQADQVVKRMGYDNQAQFQKHKKDQKNLAEGKRDTKIISGA
jgi:hypothetical protein